MAQAPFDFSMQTEKQMAELPNKFSLPLALIMTQRKWRKMFDFLGGWFYFVMFPALNSLASILCFGVLDALKSTGLIIQVGLCKTEKA